MEQIDQINILAIELIECLGNDKPEQAQIDLMEYIVSNAMKAPRPRLKPERKPSSHKVPA